MKRMFITCKIYKAETKKTENGKKYVALRLVESTKSTDGNWISEYSSVNVFEGGYNPTQYTNLCAMLKNGTIKTVENAKKEATKVKVEVNPKIGKNYKTQEPEFQYSYVGIEVVQEDTTPSVSKPTIYEAPAVHEEKKEEEDDTLPF